jgi:hypothetical protein
LTGDAFRRSLRLADTRERAASRDVRDTGYGYADGLSVADRLHLDGLDGGNRVTGDERGADVAAVVAVGYFACGGAGFDRAARWPLAR